MPSSATLSLGAPVRQFVLNTPLLRDVDDTGGTTSRYYAGAASDGGPGSKFSGAVLFRSINDSDYTRLAAQGNEVEWGVVDGVVPPPARGPYALDWDTHITIWPAVDSFSLTSITDDELYTGQNLVLIGAEAICFRDATKNEDGSWTISNLLRAQRGTEWAAASHGPVEFFVGLDANTVLPQTETLDARGQGRWFKGVGVGETLTNTPTNYITYMPRDLMPYAPENIRRVYSGADMVISWDRRTRLGGTLQDSVSAVPLNETTESYEVYIVAAPFTGDRSSNAAPAGYLRTFQTASPQVTYSAVMQGADGFNPASSILYVIVYQLSAAVGRGFPGYAAIPAWRTETPVGAPTLDGAQLTTPPDLVQAPVQNFGGGAGGYG